MQDLFKNPNENAFEEPKKTVTVADCSYFSAASSSASAAARSRSASTSRSTAAAFSSSAMATAAAAALASYRSYAAIFFCCMHFNFLIVAGLHNDTVEKWVHIDTFSAMNGISRFCENNFPWRYSKEEQISLQEFHLRNFSFLINEHPTVNGFKCIFTEDGFSRVRYKFGFPPILLVYDWMNNRQERFRVSASDAAIQLDLVAKVHGVSSAERFFLNLTDNLKDKRTHGSLLNVYVHYRLKEKAESLLDIMRSKGYVIHSLPFNVMMTLYMNLKEYDKVDMLISEMKEKNIRLDIYSYNIWLSSCESIEKMEQVFEQMGKDPAIVPNWSTFSTMATIYIKMNQFEKAEDCLRRLESRIKGRDRIPFHYLLSLYGGVGNKDEVYRVWSTYKSIFPTIPNLGYHAIVSSLIRIDDIEGAEKLYEEWVSVRSSDDARLGNLLIGWYVKNDNIDKALNFFEHMTDGGSVPNSNTWELLSEGYIADKRVSEALSCLKKAFATDGSKSWKPKPLTLSAFFKLCQDEDDTASTEILIGLLRKSGFLENEAYASLIGLSDATIGKGDLSRTDDIVDSENVDDDSQMLLNQL